MLVAGRPQRHELDEPPEHLPADAKHFWRDSIVRLIEVGLIDRVDVSVLEQLATQYARIRQAQRVIASEGHFTLGSVGQLTEHPAIRIERDATVLFHRLAEDYALTPMARSRLGLADLHARSLRAEMADTLSSGADAEGDVVSEAEVVSGEVGLPGSKLPQ